MNSFFIKKTPLISHNTFAIFTWRHVKNKLFLVNPSPIPSIQKKINPDMIKILLSFPRLFICFSHSRLHDEQMAQFHLASCISELNLQFYRIFSVMETIRLISIRIHLYLTQKLPGSGRHFSIHPTPPHTHTHTHISPPLFIFLQPIHTHTDPRPGPIPLFIALHCMMGAEDASEQLSL